MQFVQFVSFVVSCRVDNERLKKLETDVRRAATSLGHSSRRIDRQLEPEPPHRWFIWENVNGDGSSFVERIVLDKQLGTHETKSGDVDGDGDIDLVGKLWKPVPDNGNGGHNHVDFLENVSK